MKEEIEITQKDALVAIAAAGDEKSLDDARVAFLGKKGRLTIASAGMKDLSKDEKPVIGQLLNVARQTITSAIDEKQSTLAEAADKKSVEGIDLTLPARAIPAGSLVMRRIPFTLIAGNCSALIPQVCRSVRWKKRHRRCGLLLLVRPTVETRSMLLTSLSLIS